tara:strand:+ start:8748 stop:10316 length:1569 start_codon:yes stop_codon:yes gene_type:complete
MIKVFLTTLILFLSSCASQGYPSGGPVDEAGPKVVSIKPDSEIISKNQSITIVFDEMINSGTLLASGGGIRINQIPFNYSLINPEFDNSFNVRFNNNKIIIAPNNNWDDVVELELLRNISDYQGNSMESSFVKIFKTSPEGIVYNNSISGRLININYDSDYLGGTKVYSIGLFKIDDGKVTLNKITQSNFDGAFKFINIEEGSYRIAALKTPDLRLSQSFNDFNKFYRFNRYGMFFKDLDITDGKNIENISILVDEPLARKNIVSGKLINSNNAVLNLDDGAKQSVFIKNKKYSEGDSVKIDVDFSNRLESYKVKYEFIANYFLDTIPPKIEEWHIHDKNLHINFSEPIALFDENPFSYMDSSTAKYSITNHSNFVIKLEDYTKDKLFIDGNYISDYENNSIDSLISLDIPVQVDENKNENFGQLRGKIENCNFENVVVRLSSLESDVKYFTLMNFDRSYIFDKVLPGKYRLDSYHNKGMNPEVYFSGIWNPYSSAAKFSIYPDEIDVRAHWEINGIDIFYD